MGNKYGPRIIDDGLVFCLDAAGGNKTFPVDGLDVEYLIVGGGGGGGGSPHGAGGGAGGLFTGAAKATISTGTYSIVVGAGGAGKVGRKTSPWPSPGTNYGANGGNSTAFGKTAIGGGGGGGYSGGGVNDTVGRNGGSGGGTGRDPGSVGQATQPSSSDGGYGNNGGRGGYPLVNQYNHAGGGGGAGGPGYLIGSTFDATKVSFGGIGKYFGDKYSTNLGENGWFAGGGGGSYYFINVPTRLNAGLGGGGRGGYSGGDPDPGNGSVNTGGGGGGAERSSESDATGGGGGSGVVLIRYSGPPRAKGGDSIISHNGYTIHVFNSSGNFIVGETVSDLSTSKKYGTLTNMATSDYTPGTNGYFSFDGSNQYIDAGIDNTKFKFSAGDSITVIAAVNPTNINQQTRQAFMTIGGDPNVTRDRSYQMRIANYSGAGKIDVLYRNSINTSWHTLRTNSSYASNNQWIIIASTYTYKTGSTWKIYVNGEQVSTSFYSGNGNEDPIVNTNQLFIGIGEDANNTSEQWYGKIGNVLLYRDYLTADQIRDNFNALRGRYGI